MKSPLIFNTLGIEPSAVTTRVTTKAIEESLIEIAKNVFNLRDVVDICITTGDKNDKGVIIPQIHIWFDANSRNVTTTNKVTDVTGRPNYRSSAELNKFLAKYYFRNDKDKPRFVLSGDRKYIGCALNIEKILRDMFDVDNKRYAEENKDNSKDLRPIDLRLEVEWSKNGQPIAFNATKSYRRAQKRDLTPKKLQRYTD